jgi:beta-glucosidase
MDAIKARAPQATVAYYNGDYPFAAAEFARDADVVIVFATQWMTEAYDVPDLSLPNGQDELIRAVAAANKDTVVVLETGGPVLMPWLDQVGAVVQAWYSGARGGEAIADVLFGEINPSGRLPITYAANMAQLPRPKIPQAGYRDPGFPAPDAPPPAPAEFNHDVDGAEVGYRWYALNGLKPIFPFGFGLSYTTFAYSDFKVGGGKRPVTTFNVTNTGTVAGIDTPQLYLTNRTGQKTARLTGWSRIELAPGQSQKLSVSLDPRLLASWDTRAGEWRVPGGRYVISLGHSAASMDLSAVVNLPSRRFSP